MQIEDKPQVDNEERSEPPGAPSTSIRRRIAVKSEPRAVTTHEAVDGYREKAMRIESVEQIELGNIMELSIAGQVLRWARQSNLSGGVSFRKADGWNLKNHLTVARHLREKIHPIVLVVTKREGEEKGTCSAPMGEHLRIIKDQAGEECAAAMVLSRKSTIWRRATAQTLLKKGQMKYIDVDGMRVITNDKHIAEQSKSDSTLPARVSVEQEGREHRDGWSQKQERRPDEEHRDGWTKSWRI